MNIDNTHLTNKQKHYISLIKKCSNNDLIYAYKGAISALESLKLDLIAEELYTIPKHRMN